MQQLSENFHRPVCYELDISDESSVINFFEKTVSNFGRVDILVNNAWPKTNEWGVRFDEIKTESLYKDLCDHAGGYFLCCQQVTHYMKNRKQV
jgi:NAD(P)-dependent dehydrogenase (short-subunit alcohol dehydrogenase family)